MTEYHVNSVLLIIYYEVISFYFFVLFTAGFIQGNTTNTHLLPDKWYSSETYFQERNNESCHIHWFYYSRNICMNKRMCHKIGCSCLHEIKATHTEADNKTNSTTVHIKIRVNNKITKQQTFKQE